MRLTEKKITGRLGMNHIERVALEAGCKMIPVPEELDTGIDGYIEFARDEEASGRLLAFQVKCGPSFFENGHPKHQTDKRHLRYWRDYSIPVLLIVVSLEGDRAYWMDAQQYARQYPKVVDEGPYVLRPPLDQSFTSTTLATRLMPLYARLPDFGAGVALLCDSDPDRRLSALAMLYLFRMERRTPFCVSAALRLETTPTVTVSLCDFYSRYFSHPEVSFGVDADLRAYAASLLFDFGRPALLRILASFLLSDEDSSLDGAVEIFDMHPEEIWDRFDIIERGTVQQGLAEVVRVLADPETLLDVAADPAAASEARQAAIALFGYLGYSCPVQDLEAIYDASIDQVIRALLFWVRHWIVEESKEASP